jgi:hypothetical protein
MHLDADHRSEGDKLVIEGFKLGSKVFFKVLFELKDVGIRIYPENKNLTHNALLRKVL